MSYSMWWLNRLRGTHSWWAKIIAVGLGVVFGLLTWNYYIGLAVAIGYLAGESMGWGQWIGALVKKDYGYEDSDEGKRNGINWLAEKFSIRFSQDYHVTALFIRGLYWWGLTFVSLYWVLDPLLVTMVILFLASWFPLSVMMAESNDKQWKSAENIYGGAQDVGVLMLVIGALT